MSASNIECNIIDWRITAKCNCSCDYCYASANLPEVSQDTIKIIIESIIKSGCRTVCISGGEPLLNDNAISIIRQLHSCGISIFLSTNGIEYMKHREELEKYISKLSLPLDGYDEESNKINGREISTNIPGCISEFQAVKNILDYYEKHTHNFAIKIGSVLTSKNLNIDHFKKIHEFLSNYSIDKWKIYEFIPEGRGKANHKDLAISPDQLSTFIADFKHFQTNILSDEKFDCILSTRNMRDAAYFIIQPNGTVIVPIDNNDNGVTEVQVGDLTKQDITDVLNQWNSLMNSIRYNLNFETRLITRSWAKTHIDKIDKEIIYYLDRNPLQNYSELASKIKGISISTEELEKRIDKLYSIRAIRHIMPIINVSQFGLEVFLLNLYFKSNSTLDSAQIVEILCHDPYIAWVAECVEYNSSNKEYLIFRISIFNENIAKLNERIKHLRSIFGETLYRYETDMVPDKYICGKSFLMDKIDSSLLNYDHIILNSSQTKLSKKEYSVILAMNSSERLTIDTIAKASSLSKKTVIKIIDDLLSRTVINKFQVVLDANVLGYRCYKFFVKFDSCESKDLFEDYVKTLPSVTHINTLNAGSWDIDVEIHAARDEDCSAIWTDLENQFADNILEKKLIRIKREHKFKFLIDTTLNSIEDSVDSRWWKK